MKDIIGKIQEIFLLELQNIMRLFTVHLILALFCLL